MHYIVHGINDNILFFLSCSHIILSFYRIYQMSLFILVAHRQKKEKTSARQFRYVKFIFPLGMHRNNEWQELGPTQTSDHYAKSLWITVKLCKIVTRLPVFVSMRHGLYYLAYLAMVIIMPCLSWFRIVYNCCAGTVSIAGAIDS